MKSTKALPIHDMEKRHQGLTKAIADCYTEAARVCLDRYHVSPVDMRLRAVSTTEDATVTWLVTDSVTRNAWANTTDATEAGAYACALAAIELVEGLVAVHRAETRTGADYYVAPPGTVLHDLEECMRFEISGVSSGPESLISQRLLTKLQQAEQGISDLPALAGVVGFAARLIVLAKL